MSQIQGALIHLFHKYRIVFWYDTKHELRGEFESLILPGVELVELKNNEFAVKHRVLREQPGGKFLLYLDGPRPPDLENWLLDVLLAQGEFQADQAALWLAELELTSDSLELVQNHAAFFSPKERRAALKALLRREDTASEIRMKMLAVCTGAEPRLDEVLEALLAELPEGSEEKFQLVQHCSLDDFLWDRLGRAFSYQSATPGMQDFAIELFKSCYALELGQPARFTQDALVFVKRWKDSLSQHPVFETLSQEYGSLLNIEHDLSTQDLRSLAEVDLFRLVDLKIISDLVSSVVNRTISSDDCATFIRQRRRSHWYTEFQNLYETIDHAAQFLALLDRASLVMDTLAEGVQRYIQAWFRLDQMYRKVIYHARRSGQVTVLEPLVALVENHYTNNYLLKVNNNWQAVVDASPRWESGALIPQRHFFDHWIAPFLNAKKKVYVIISDALRYEATEELLGLVRREDRYEAQIEAMLSTLPSYTQAGMAALLPNREMKFSENETGTVIVDGINSQGTPNRDKILKEALNGFGSNRQAAAIRAEDLLNLNRDGMRDLLRDNDVVYIYHNRIDSVGDKKESEERVFEAVEETLDELMVIIKKLTAANATNLIVTADHGFIYQNRAIDESDFSTAEANGQPVYFLDRRFVLGKGLTEHPGLRKFTATQVGLEGNVEIQIPKSIHRLRQKGSGSRFVHGGAALQEVVVPVLLINKKRESDLSKVTVDIMRAGSNLITAGQLSVSFYQVEPVSEKVQPRKLRAGIYTQAGVLISDKHELVFDLESGDPRQREVKLRFILTQSANQANNQEVILRLDEQVGSTSHYQEYRTMRYTLRRSFTSDFEF